MKMRCGAGDAANAVISLCAMHDMHPARMYKMAADGALSAMIPEFETARRQAALVVLLIVLTVLPYLALTPEPILAAIVIHALWRGLSLQPLGRYFIWRRDRLLVICANKLSGNTAGLCPSCEISQ